MNRDLVQRGAFLFMDPRISGDRATACASCHPGGGSDGAYYAQGDAVEPGSPGARRAPELRGLWQTAPYLWNGSAPTVRAALERMLAIEMRGAQIAEVDKLALEQYLLSIPPFDNGRVNAEGRPVEPATLSSRRGADVFKEASCDNCHTPPTYAHSRIANVGSGQLNVPSLRNLKNRKRYGHDGRWPNLDTAVRSILEYRETQLTRQQHHHLLQYLELL